MMLHRHAYGAMFMVLFPTACFASPVESLTASTELQGRFYFAGKDLTATSPHGVVVVQSLYEMPASGGSPVPRLPDFKRVSNLVWYPSSAKIGLNNSDDPHRGLFLLDTSGRNDSPEVALSPKLVPIFTTVINAEPHSTSESLTIYPTQVAISPDGMQVAGVDHGNHLCVVSRDGGSAPRCEQQVKACVGSTPAWSPDGRMIVFAAALPADNTSCNLYELFLMDVASSTVKQLTDIPGPRIGSQPYGSVVKKGETMDRWHKTNHPEWSPDGQWIAFTTYGGIGRIRPDGTGLSILAKGASPAWSPDGTMIAYRVPRKVQPKGVLYPGYNISWTLYVSRADGTGPIEIPVDPKISVEDVAWTR
jgi:WD40 repeat protein